MVPVSRAPIFVTCAPGLEPVLHAELRALRAEWRGAGFARLERQVGGCYLEGTRGDLERLCLGLSTATRVLLRVARFAAWDADALARGAAEVPWERWLAPAGSLAVAAHATDSALDHTMFIAQRVKDAICDRFRVRGERRPDVDREDPDLLVHAHLVRDRCTLSIDASGEPLFKRGWRRRQGRAPLAETLAAAIVRLAGWDARAPLLDPFCGSGTLLVEAALLAAGVAPGSVGRRFGFERWLDHDPARFARTLAAVREKRRPLPRKLRLVGSDRSQEAVGAAAENIAAAGFDGQVELEARDVRELKPRRGWNAWLVSNPPYGERVGRGEDLVALYEDLGALVRERCAGYRVHLLLADRRHLRALALEPVRRTRLVNGGLPVELVELRP